MSETREPYTTGPISVKDGMEVFYVWIDYNELDVPTGKSQAKQFTCEALALDAAAALSLAVKQLRTAPPPAGKVWGVVATVEVASDVLRDKLKDTLPGPATIRRLAELAFDYAGAETAYHQDQANTEALNIARDPEQYRQWGQVVDHVARGLITTIDQAQQALTRAKSS